MNQELGPDGKPIVKPNEGGAEGEVLDDDEGEEPPAQGGDPVKAMHEERGKRKELAKENKVLKEKLAAAEPMVAEYQTLLPHLPALLAGAKAAPAAAVIPGQLTPEQQELSELATDMGFVDEDGKPDLLRAHRVLGRINARAERVAQQIVDPVRQTSAQAAIQQIKDKAYNATDKDGNLYATREAIDQVFSVTPAAQLLDPNGAVAALIMARGLGGPGKAQEEPLHVEGPGRGPKGVPVLSDMERAVAKIRGKSEKDWQALSNDAPADTGWELEKG